MLSKLRVFLREREMLRSGDRVICAVSGGADSVALLFAFYLLKDELDITLEAAHFNHHLRGEESDRDEQFVKELCHRYDIPLHLGGGTVKPGKKGLEAAARDARYAFFRTLEGKIATAHTADDNAETVLMHMVRGTGLKGLGGIPPVSGTLIRPMLTVTRLENEEFLEEWCLRHVEDSSNGTDTFLRNRLRRHVMPLLREENPRLAENLSRMALRLREDEAYLAEQSDVSELPDVQTLKTMHPALRSRCLERFLRENGLREPEERHIRAVEGLLTAASPSARVDLPGGVTIARNYDRLERRRQLPSPEPVCLPCPGQVQFGDYTIFCAPAQEIRNTPDTFTVIPRGDLTVTSRREGDQIRLSGGTRSLKKAFIDRKIPAAERSLLPVIRDEAGILGVYAIGVHRERVPAALPAVTIHVVNKNIENKGE